MRPRVGISSCLLTSEHDSHRLLREELGPHVEWVPYTTEMETGLGALWETWRLTGLSGLVSSTDLDGYVAHAEPHCPGLAFWDGPGLFAGRLATAFPLLTVADVGKLSAWDTRARFAERVFAAARLRALFAGSWRPRDLVAFHTRHKLQILAHDPARYQEAGRTVARAGSRPSAETERDYRRIFGSALASDVTLGRNVNAMQRAFRHVGRELDAPLRHTVLDRIHGYESGELPFIEPLGLLARHAAADWVAGQTYFRPFPGDLRRQLWYADRS
jgi:uncharacterized protein YbgA (DUF1722 family)